MEYPKVYKKAIKGVVGGRILIKRGDAYVEEEFLLVGDPATTDIDKITLEVTDEVSEKHFVRNNKATLTNGYLIETSNPGLAVDMTNAVSDGYLHDLLKEPFTQLKVKLNQFTSPVPVQRLLTIANTENKPIKTIELIKQTIVRLEGK
jgi:hypothetical protein